METSKTNTNKLTAKQRTEKTVKTLSAKNERTAHENVLLANALYKTEVKTLGFVYSTLKREFYNEEKSALSEAVREIVGKKFPTRTAFKRAYKAQTFHVWGGLQTLKRINPANQRAERVKRQNKATAKKMGNPIATTAKAKVKTAKA